MPSASSVLYTHVRICGPRDVVVEREERTSRLCAHTSGSLQGSVGQMAVVTAAAPAQPSALGPQPKPQQAPVTIAVETDKGQELAVKHSETRVPVSRPAPGPELEPEPPPGVPPIAKKQAKDLKKLSVNKLKEKWGKIGSDPAMPATAKKGGPRYASACDSDNGGGGDGAGDFQLNILSVPNTEEGDQGEEQEGASSETDDEQADTDAAATQASVAEEPEPEPKLELESATIEQAISASQPEPEPEPEPGPVASVAAQESRPAAAGRPVQGQSAGTEEASHTASTSALGAPPRPASSAAPPVTPPRRSQLHVRLIPYAVTSVRFFCMRRKHVVPNG
jgi:hypothetical protein